MSIDDLLVGSWPRTDFFTAVSILERLTADAPRIGEDGPVADEAISFRHDPSFAFRPNELSSISREERYRSAEQRLETAHKFYEVVTCILGLSGADSPLPLYHAEDLLPDTDEARLQRHFLDLFHNRLTAFLYRGISKYRYPNEFMVGGRDTMSARLLALVGVDVFEGIEGPLSRHEYLRISGLLALGTGTARTVEQALLELMAEELDGAPLRFEQFTGGWVTFDPDQRVALGRANSDLAETFVIGTRALHPADRARVVIGPISPLQARQFSPGGPHYDRIKKILPALCSDPIGFELELLVSEDDFPRFLLGRKASTGLGQGVMISARKPGRRIARHLFDLDKTQPGSQRHG